MEPQTRPQQVFAQIASLFSVGCCVQDKWIVARLRFFRAESFRLFGDTAALYLFHYVSGDHLEQRCLTGEAWTKGYFIRLYARPETPNLRKARGV
jgi:hypothetical protein